MTAQQIEYWKLQEQNRANVASEAENKRYHLANEEIQKQINAETNRHNLAVESINRWATSVAEKNAAINALNAQTSARLANLTEKRDLETARHNAALEGIQHEYNQATLALSGKRLDQDATIATADRSSREGIATQQVGYTLAGTLIGATSKLFGSGDGKSPITSHNVQWFDGVVTDGGTTVNPVTSGAAAGTAAKAAGTVLGSVAIPAGMILGGTLLAGYLAKNNVPYPFNTSGLSADQFNKEVKYYGAE